MRRVAIYDRGSRKGNAGKGEGYLREEIFEHARRIILLELTKAKGNVAKAARMLGESRQTLYKYWFPRCGITLQDIARIRGGYKNGHE